MEKIKSKKRFGNHDVTIDFREFRGHITFDNGYGASVVSHQYSYGGLVGLFEIAKLNKDGSLDHDSVEGWLTADEVTDRLNDIENLKQ